MNVTKSKKSGQSYKKVYVMKKDTVKTGVSEIKLPTIKEYFGFGLNDWLDIIMALQKECKQK